MRQTPCHKQEVLNLKAHNPHQTPSRLLQLFPDFVIPSHDTVRSGSTSTPYLGNIALPDSWRADQSNKMRSYQRRPIWSSPAFCGIDPPMTVAPPSCTACRRCPVRFLTFRQMMQGDREMCQCSYTLTAPCSHMVLNTPPTQAQPSRRVCAPSQRTRVHNWTARVCVTEKWPSAMFC